MRGSFKYGRMKNCNRWMFAKDVGRGSKGGGGRRNVDGGEDHPFELTLKSSCPGEEHDTNTV